MLGCVGCLVLQLIVFIVRKEGELGRGGNRIGVCFLLYPRRLYGMNKLKDLSAGGWEVEGIRELIVPALASCIIFLSNASFLIKTEKVRECFGSLL